MIKADLKCTEHRHTDKPCGYLANSPRDLRVHKKYHHLTKPRPCHTLMRVLITHWSKQTWMIMTQRQILFPRRGLLSSLWSEHQIMCEVGGRAQAMKLGRRVARAMGVPFEAQ